MPHCLFPEIVSKPGQAIKDMPDLGTCFLCDCQWLSQNTNIAQFWRHDMQITLVVNHLLGHKPMYSLNTAFRVVTRSAKVCIPCATRPAFGMGTGAAHSRHHQITYLHFSD